MNFDINQMLNIARILGQVLTEVAKIKEAMPQEEAVKTRGPDQLAVAKGDLAVIVSKLERDAKAPPS